MSYYIGIDLGTSSVKLCLTDEKGNLIKECSKSYKLLQPYPDWKEIKPETWWENTCEAMKELLKGIDGNLVKGIGVTGQMHTLILLGEQGEVVRPAMMWNDTRTASLIPDMKRAIKGTEIGYLDRILSTGSPAANILWVRENERNNFDKIRKFLIGPDYIVYRLTGVYGTDYCEASTSSMYDTVKKCWSPIMKEFLELADDIYPEVKGSAEAAGVILPELAEHFGINPETIVIVGTGDNPAASIPTGCLGRNHPVFSMGTSGVLMFPREKLDYEAKKEKISCFLLIVSIVIFWYRVWYSRAEAVLAGGMRKIMESENYRHIDSMLDTDKLGENSLLFYPHLTGDKTIYADPMLRGAFIGLCTDTTKADMTLAVMEGIAFALKQLSQEMHLTNTNLEELKVIGGGSKSRVWMQILADVMKLRIAQMGGKGGAGYGIALLAAYTCGEIDSVEQISDCAVEVKEYFYPRSYNASLYEMKYKKYLQIHDALLPIF